MSFLHTLMGVVRHYVVLESFLFYVCLQLPEVFLFPMKETHWSSSFFNVWAKKIHHHTALII